MSFQISCLLNFQVWLPLARLGFRTPTDSVKVADTLWVGRKRLDLAGGWLLEYDVLRHDCFKKCTAIGKNPKLFKIWMVLVC